MKKLMMMCVMILLTACHAGGRYIYTYTSPASPMGKYCISQCVEKKNLCMQMCQVKLDQCKTKEQENAFYRYQMYHDDQVAKGLPVKRFIKDFDRSSIVCCRESICDCRDHYNSCYVECGGTLSRRLGK